MAKEVDLLPKRCMYSVEYKPVVEEEIGGTGGGWERHILPHESDPWVSLCAHSYVCTFDEMRLSSPVTTLLEDHREQTLPSFMLTLILSPLGRRGARLFCTQSSSILVEPTSTIFYNSCLYIAQQLPKQK